MRSAPQPSEKRPWPCPVGSERLAAPFPRARWLCTLEAELKGAIDERLAAGGSPAGGERARIQLLARVAGWLGKRCRSRLDLPAGELSAAALVLGLARLEIEAHAAPLALEPPLAARWADSLGLSASVVDALAAQSAGEPAADPGCGASLLALADRITRAVSRGNLDQAELALSPAAAAELGLRRIDMAVVVAMAASELARSAA